MEDKVPTPEALEPGERVEVSELEQMLDTAVGRDRRVPARSSHRGAVVGKLIGFTDNGATPLVTFPGQRGDTAAPARATVDVHRAHVGREIVLVFEEQDPERPIIIGCVRDPTHSSLPEVPGQVDVDADGERLVLSARQEIVLRCGTSSVTLRRDGKVVIRGAHVVSHASGTNRIRGGSVQVN